MHAEGELLHDVYVDQGVVRVLYSVNVCDLYHQTHVLCVSMRMS